MMDEKRDSGAAPDPMQTSDVGDDTTNHKTGRATPVSGPGQVLSGGMSSDAESVSAPELGGPSGESAGGDGSIGGEEGIDDGATHGGGTAALPGDEEVMAARREREAA